MSPRDIATTLGYKNVRNARLHLGVLERDGLVRRSSDGVYERSARNLDEAAKSLGVLGATEKQGERYRLQSSNWGRWCDAFDHWRQTGEVTDPDTGELVATESIPHKGTSIHTFRQRVLLIRARTNEDRSGNFTTNPVADAGSSPRKAELITDD